VDTRADVYGLGGLLYELLTDTPPLELDKLRTAPFTETLRAIREDDPPRPSARLSTADGPLDAKRTARAREVRGDLDWIVMKCLEKDRTRRYDTASGLVRDVERYLSDEPIEARPPSAVYRASKFVRRHRRAAVAGGAVAAALVLGLIGTTAGMVRANSERTKAERRLAQVERGADILASIFDDLNPQAADGRSLRVVLGRRLDAAAAALDGDAVGDPLTVARLQYVLGTTYTGLGYPNKAIALLTRALAIRTAELGPRHADTLATMNSLGGALRDAGRLKEAVPLYEETLRLRRAEHGDDDLRTINTMNGLVSTYVEAGRTAEARTLADEVYRRASTARGPKDEDTLAARCNLAAVLRDAGLIAEALGHFQAVRELRTEILGPRRQETLQAMSHVAITLLAAGRADAALTLNEETLALQETELGPHHRETLGTMAEIAVCRGRLGHRADAVRRHRDVLRLRTAHLGPDHPDTLQSMNNLAVALDGTDEARTLLADTLKQTTAVFGPGHPATLKAMMNMAAVRADAKELAAAIQLYTTALAAMRPLYDNDHPDLIRCLGDLAGTQLTAKQPAPALLLLAEYLPAERARLGADDPGLAAVLARFGKQLFDAKQPTQAEPLLRESLKIRSEREADLWTTAETAVWLGFVLDEQDKTAEAAVYLIRGYEGLKRLEKDLPPNGKALLPHTASQLFDLYTEAGDEEAAERWRAKMMK
jgi:eukaryotic-like serine/threonine-protein kinase